MAQGEELTHFHPSLFQRSPLSKISTANLCTQMELNYCRIRRLLCLWHFWLGFKSIIKALREIWNLHCLRGHISLTIITNKGYVRERIKAKINANNFSCSFSWVSLVWHKWIYKNKNVFRGLIVMLPCSSLDEFLQRKYQAQNSSFHHPVFPLETRGHAKDNRSKLFASFTRVKRRKLWGPL